MTNRIPVQPEQSILDKVNNLWDIDPIEGKIISKQTGCEIGFKIVSDRTEGFKFF